MAIIYRKLDDKDLDVFINLRIRQLREEGATEKLDLVPALTDYYHRHMADGTFVSWLALDGEKIIGTSGMSFVEKTSVFWLSFGQDRPSVQHVYRPVLSPPRDRERAA